MGKSFLTIYIVTKILRVIFHKRLQVLISAHRHKEQSGGIQLRRREKREIPDKGCKMKETEETSSGLAASRCHEYIKEKYKCKYQQMSYMH